MHEHLVCTKQKWKRKKMFDDNNNNYNDKNKL